MISDGFKAHGAGLGPKLGQALASGVSGLQRRIEAARARERAAELERRVATVRALNAWAGPGEADLPVTDEQAGEGLAVIGELHRAAPDKRERGVVERGTGGEVGGIEAGAREFVDRVLPDAASAVRAEVAGKVARKMARATGTKLGRPKVEGVRPWAAAGVSRRTWERRRKKEAGG